MAGTNPDNIRIGKDIEKQAKNEKKENKTDRRENFSRNVSNLLNFILYDKNDIITEEELAEPDIDTAAELTLQDKNIKPQKKYTDFAAQDAAKKDTELFVSPNTNEDGQQFANDTAIFDEVKNSRASYKRTYRNSGNSNILNKHKQSDAETCEPDETLNLSDDAPVEINPAGEKRNFVLPNNEKDNEPAEFELEQNEKMEKFTEYEFTADSQTEDFPTAKKITTEPELKSEPVNAYTVSAGTAPSRYRNQQAAQKTKAAAPRLNLFDLVKRACIVLFALAAGALCMPAGLYPLGIALISAADTYIFYIYAGLAASLIFCETGGVVLFCIYTLIAGVKFFLKYNKEKTKAEILSRSQSYRNLQKKERSKLISMLRFNDAGSIILSILVCAVACCAAGFFDLAMKSGGLVYTDIVKVLLFVLISMLFTYLYSGLFDSATDNRMLELAGICAVIYTMAYLFAPVNILNLSIGYIFSFVVTLSAAASGTLGNHMKKEEKSEDRDEDDDEKAEISEGEELINRFSANLVAKDGTLSDMTKGALTGLLCGIAIGDTAGAVTLGVAGLIAGLFFSQSAVLAVAASLISSISYAVYIAGSDAISLYIPNMAIGITLFLPLSFMYSNITKGLRTVSHGEKSVTYAEKRLLVSDLPASRLKNLSEAFDSLSTTFYSLSKKMKNPSAWEIKALVTSTAENICESCENRELCTMLANNTTYNEMITKATAYINSKKKFDADGLTPTFAERCLNAGTLVSSVNEFFISRVDEKIRSDKTDIFASHYESIAKLFRTTMNGGREDIALKTDISDKIYVRLSTMGIECENVIVMGERKKTLYVFGIKMTDYTGTIDDLLDMFEKFCEVRFSEPEYILKENFVILKCESVNSYKIHSLAMERAAGCRENAGAELAKPNINGDSISTFASDSGYFYGLISDGMGCGKNAAMASRMTSLLMEKLLSGGGEKDLTLEMLNNMLLSKNDECFATVDLFEADLITGKATFIKAGAAPSFVIRNKKLFKIQSSTVPAGIVDKMNSEQTKFDLEYGDYVVMLSDGIISTYEEGAWLLEMLSDERGIAAPKTLLAEILASAKQKNPRQDDMSVMILRVGEEMANKR